MKNLTEYNKNLSILRKKDIKERSIVINLEHEVGIGILKQADAATVSTTNANGGSF